MFKKGIVVLCLMIYLNAWSTATPFTILKAVEEDLIIDGQKTKVFNIIQPDGTNGFIGKKGDYFNVLLKNETTVPISIHWHGLILPNNQDGIPYVTQLPIPPGKSYHYYFKILQAGTFWMHSHLGFNEQRLMTAPLILKDPNDPYRDDKEVVIMLQGFIFENPETVFYHLRHKNSKMQSMEKNPDLNDVKFNVYLANRRTLKNPQIIIVKPNEKIRLRLINASTATNFWINTGKLPAKAIATDGNSINPFIETHFPIAVAQRLDLEVTIPHLGGVFPILAQAEGTQQQTGVILTTSHTGIPFLKEISNQIASPVNNLQEFKIHPLHSLLPKPINLSLKYILSGNMQNYIWKINDEIWPHITPYKIKKGDRIEMVFINNTGMAHPMHFHGHVFQITEINGVKLTNGPLRDTTLVLPHTYQKIIFDANNPGIWMMHCHVLYHMIAGMMTTTNYKEYPTPSYYQALLAGKIKEE